MEEQLEYERVKREKLEQQLDEMRVQVHQLHRKLEEERSKVDEVSYKYNYVFNYFQIEQNIFNLYLR